MRIMLAALLFVVFARPSLARADGDSDGDECTPKLADSTACNAFGHRGAMSFSFGWTSVGFDPSGRSFAIKRVGFANQIGTVDGNTLARVRGNGMFLEPRLHITPHFYAGLDLGAAWAGGAPSQSAGPSMMTWDRTSILTMAGVAGARISLGRVSLRGELVAGIHGATVSGESSSSLRADTIAAVLEPRVAVDVWIHRWWVIEGFAGANALDRSEQMFGLGLGFHSQAFDGRY